MATALSITSHPSASMQESNPSVGVNSVFLKGSILDDELRGFMRNVWTTNKYSDFTLTALGHRFKVHKVFLSAHASYFSQGPGDLSQDTGAVDLEPEVLELVIKFLYEGQIEVVKDTIPKLQGAADFLGVDALKNQCRYVSLCGAELTPDNCLDIWDAAVCVNNEATANQALQMALAHFDDCQNLPEFTQLPLSRILELLPHPQLNVHGADERLGAAVNWAMYDSDARIEHVPQILDSLPLQTMTPWYLRQVMNNPVLRASSATCTQIKAALARGNDAKELPQSATQSQQPTKQQATPHLSLHTITHQAHNTCFVATGVPAEINGIMQLASNKIWTVDLHGDMCVTMRGQLQTTHNPVGTQMCGRGSDLFIGGLGEDRTQLWQYNLQTEAQWRIGR